MQPVTLEVLAPIVSGVRHCPHCQDFFEDAGVAQAVNRDELDSYPEEMWRDYERLSEIVRELAGRYGTALRVTLIDPHTPLGLWKSLRHWVRSYPTFIVNGQEKVTGWDSSALDSLLRAQLRS